MAKKTKKKKNKTSIAGDPVEVVAKVDLTTPIVSTKPQTPQDDETPDNDKPKQQRRTKKVIEAEAVVSKQQADELIAKTIVDMKVALMTRVGGQVWSVEKAEYDALVMAYKGALAQFPSIPWWLGLALAEGAYIGPRLIIMTLERAKAIKEAKAKQAPQGAVAPDPTVLAAAAAVGTNDPNHQLDPAA